jgi:hypothetical protein
MDYKKFMDKLTERVGREDDEYHNGPDPVKHTYNFKVSKDGAEPHHRSVTTPMTRKPKHELEGLARAHLEKQGYKIHEGLDIIARSDYKLDKAGKKSHKEIVFHNGDGNQEKDDKLKREEVEMQEEKMTDDQMKERERMVKGMKKGMSGFKERYGDRAKSVMYATATKQAMKD